MNFFKKNSYTIVKLFITQLAISILGNVLAIACGMAKYDTLKLVTSIFAVLFFVFLNYSALWEIGYKQIPSIEAGRTPRVPLTGLYMALWASVPNFLLAVLVMLGNLLNGIGFFSTLGAIAAMLAIWIEGMYTGILSFIKINAHPANSYWISYNNHPRTSRRMARILFRHQQPSPDPHKYRRDPRGSRTQTRI